MFKSFRPWFVRALTQLLTTEIPDTLIMNIVENAIKLAVGVVF